MNSDKQIQLYLEGSLVGQELKNFRKRLTEDAAFRKLFQDYQKVWNLIEKQHRKLTLKERLRERLRMSQKAISVEQMKVEIGSFSTGNDINSDEEKMLLEVIQSFMKSRSKKSRRIGLILALAAGLILLIGMPVAFHRIKESRNSALVYEQYFAPYPYLLHERSIPDNISALDNRAMYLYTINNYAEAAALMEKESSDSLTNPLQNLYLGVCYMELKQYSNAIKIFETLLSKDQNLTNHQARWYLGLSYIKLNKRTKATEQLNILQADSGLYTYQALEILNKLKQN